MKFRVLYSLMIISGLFVVASAFRFDTNGSPCDAPLIGAGYAGAPGESNCSLCHSGTANSGPGNLSFDLGSGLKEYVPGQTYTATIKLNQSSINKFGFQVIAMKDNDNSFTGSYTLTDITNTRMINGAAGKKYVGTTGCGSDATTTDSIRWSFDWTAPSTNEGNITIYLSAIAVNHNHSATGDDTYTANIQLSPGTVTGIENSTLLENSFRVFPNPASSGVQIKYNLEEKSNVNISILDLEGREIDVVASGEKEAGEYTYVLDLNKKEYSSGMYIIKVTANGKNFSRKLNVL